MLIPGLPLSRYVPLNWTVTNPTAGGAGAGRAARGPVPEAPFDGQLYVRIAQQWHAGLKLIGGMMLGPLRLAQDATDPLEAITKRQANLRDGGSY